MKVTPIEVEAFEVWEVDRLDPIQVFWQDIDKGKGRVVIVCFSQAWSAYFNAMGENRTIRELFQDADVQYMADALRPTRKDLAYLKRIVQAVKDSLQRLSTEPTNIPLSS